MKVNDIVYHDRLGPRRYGIVQRIYVKQEKGVSVPWTYVEVNWFEDEVYEAAIKYANTLRKQSSHAFKEVGLKEYHCGHLKILDLDAEIEKLIRLRKARENITT